MAVVTDSRWTVQYGIESSINRYFYDDYETRLSFQTAGTSCVLPVLPSELTISQGNSHVRHKVINGYEVTQLGTRAPREFSIESFFPEDRHSYNFTQPWELVDKKVTTTSRLGNVNQREVYLDQKSYIEFFDSAMDNGIPMRVVFRGMHPIAQQANIYTVENFSYSYTAGTKDVKFKLDFKEYMDASVFSYTVAKVDEQTGAVVIPPVSNPISTPKTGSFAIGDKVTGTGRWTESSDGTGTSGPIPSGKVFTIGLIATASYVTHPYNLAENGIYRGWVKASQIKHA